MTEMAHYTSVLQATVCLDEDIAIQRLADGGTVLETDGDGWTALHHAAMHDLATLCETLLKYGARVDARTRSDVSLIGKVIHASGRTPLHCAAAHGAVAAVRVLIKHSASVDAVDVDGNNPLCLVRLESVGAKMVEVLNAAGCPECLACDPAEKRKADIAAGMARLEALKIVPDHLLTPYIIPATFIVDECLELLRLLEGVSWTKERHRAHVTRDLPASEVQGCAPGGWAYERLVAALRGVAPRHGFDPDGYAFRDLFFVRYDAAPGGQPGLSAHRDGSIMSFNVLLSDPADFAGGGTEFYPDDARPEPSPVPRSNRGDMLVHAGRQLHGAAQVTSGVRIVLVGFVDVVILPLGVPS